MGQKGQRSDTHTLTHEAQTLTRDVVTAPFRLRTYRLIRKILIGFILVSIANVLFSYFFYTPKMYRIIRENRDLVIKYRILQDRIRTAQRHVDEIRPCTVPSSCTPSISTRSPASTVGSVFCTRWIFLPLSFSSFALSASICSSLSLMALVTTASTIP